MNIFSNVGITELILILLLALIVVGPERLPELAQRLGKTLRDLRKLYENLASDLGPELMSLQKGTQELRDSVESVRSIPKEMVKQVVKAAELDETVGELKGVSESVEQVGQTLSQAKRVVRDPVTAAVDSVRGSLAADQSALKGQETGPEAQAKADAIATEPEAPQTGEETTAEADDISERPEPEAEEMGTDPLAAQQAPDRGPSSSAQPSIESRAVEQDHE